jgi:hypothetical protein
MSNGQPPPDTKKSPLDKIVKIVNDLTLPFRKPKKDQGKTIYPLF